jgi:hypothetical protein
VQGFERRSIHHIPLEVDFRGRCIHYPSELSTIWILEMERYTPDIRRYTTDSSFGIDSLGASYELCNDICCDFDILKKEHEVDLVERR